MADDGKSASADKRKERQRAWEAAHSPDERAAAKAERLARLRLKFKLGGLVESARTKRSHIYSAGEIAHAASRPVRKLLVVGGGAAMRQREVLRRETRSTQIAHGFMRGRPYAAIELICYTRPDWKRVGEIIAAHMHGDERGFQQRVEQWMQAASAAADDNFKGYEPSNAETLSKLLRKRAKLDAAIKECGG